VYLLPRLLNPTIRVNEMWQTDFTYFRVISWGRYYLSTLLDDYSHFIVAWRLSTSMSVSDAQDTLDDAISFTGLDQVKIKHRPRLLSDNGPCHISGELADYLQVALQTQPLCVPHAHQRNRGLRSFPRWII